MPLYSFECTKGHIFEKIIPYSEISIKIKCESLSPKCRAKAQQVWLSSRTRRMAQNFQPTRLFMREDGELIVPGRNDLSQLPKSYINRIKKQGYKPIEITNFREYEKFKNQVNEKLKTQSQKQNEKDQQLYNEMIQSQIGSLIRGEGVEIPDGQGGMKRVNMRLSDMSPRGRAMAEIAIRKAQDHRFKSDDPQFYGNAFENDNIHYRDEDTRWKRRY